MCSIPRFFVQDSQLQPDIYTQQSRIRQGCPLSPCLFILLMTFFFNEVYDRIGVALLNDRLPHLRYSDVLYADDMLLITTHPHQMNSFLKIVEQESSYYNLKFNHSKCQVISMNGQHRIAFQYGTRIENVNVSKYLGSLLSSAACTTLEINNRISAAMDAICSIRLFWRCDCPLLWKLAVYEAI